MKLPSRMLYLSSSRDNETVFDRPFMRPPDAVSRLPAALAGLLPRS
jgi:hypothetical protein